MLNILGRVHLVEHLIEMFTVFVLLVLILFSTVET